MSFALGPVATLDQFDTATTREVQTPCFRLTGWVSNAPVFYQLRSVETGHWSEDKYIPAAAGQSYFFTFSRHFNGVRFRSATRGTPATVVVDLLTEQDLPSQ